MDPTEVNKPSIFQTLQTNPKFSLFVKACTDCGLDQTLTHGGPYTLFSPSDLAFSRLSKEHIEDLFLPENRDQLVTILTYHILPVEMSYMDLKNGRLRTLSGKKCEVIRNAEMLTIGHAMIIDFDIVCENGILHVVDKVIFPHV